MNRSTSLRNKLIYVSILILMLIPLFLLGQPDSGRSDQSGGQLTRMRDDFEMAESDLGDIDPASETMKLTSLGMRGPAATLLWKKAHDHRVHHEWDRLRAVQNNIALLQPHFEKVWEFQAHDMAYNVSAEFDDYRQRYAWVKSGTEYLSEGVRLNRRAPRLIWYTGWFYGQKLGMADERTEFRELFRHDDAFHQRIAEEGIDVNVREAKGPDQLPDNWLVGRLWLNRGYELTRKGGVTIKRQTPLNFYETGPKWRIQHAVAVEREWDTDSIDNIGEASRRTWQFAADEWREFGDADIPTTAEFTIRLGSLDELQRRLRDLQREFDELTENVREKLRQERFEQLTDAQRAALEVPEAERDEEQYTLAFEAKRQMKPSAEAVTAAVPPDKKLATLRLAGQIHELERRIQKTDGYRNQINYEYWNTRCVAEQDEKMVEARRLVHEAEAANDQAKLDEAIELYEQAWDAWAEVFEQYPLLVIDAASDDLMDSINRYRRSIDREDFPDDFPLKDFVARRELHETDPAEYRRLQELQRKKLKDIEDAKRLVDLDFRAMATEAISGSKAKREAERDPAAEPAADDAGEPANEDASDAETPETDATDADAPEADESDAEAPDSDTPDANAPGSAAPDADAPESDTPDADDSAAGTSDGNQVGS